MTLRMISRIWKKIEFRACLAGFLFFCAAGALAAQSPSASIHGQVTDPSGAAVAGATVLLTTPTGDSMDTVTSAEGFYEFKNLAHGNYEIKAVAKGFALFDKSGIALAAEQTLRVNIPLAMEVQQEKVIVNDTTTQVDASPTNNANTIVLQGKDLEALSDDPDELESELQALAGPSAGPNGGQIYIDGFTAGQLPPKASIREIRVNQNPFSSEYDRLGYGRVEIFTKPGTDKLHGQVMISGNDSAFNGRNPFEILPANTAAPDYHSEQYSGNIGGAINKKASFFFNIEQRQIQALNIVSSTVICGDPHLLIPCPSSDAQFSIIPYSAAVANPHSRTNLSPRIDYQLTPSNTLTARYQFFHDSESNDDVGEFNLAEVGTNSLSTEHTLQVTDTQTINAGTINEVRFQYVHDSDLTTPVNPVINVNVGGAFNGLGSGGGSTSEIENRYEVQDIIYKNFRKHAWKFGGRLRATNDNSSTQGNFVGQYTFGSRPNPDPTCVPSAENNNCVITPIEAYQITESLLAQGQTIPYIQTQGGGASFYTQTTGTPGATVTLVDAGLFVQDDWKVRQNVTVSYGLRFETQNHFSDHSDFAPRLGVAWGIGGNAKNPPKTVLRAGFGMFYDRFAYNLELQQLRYNVNGSLQSEFQVANPQFFIGQTPVLPPTATGSNVYENNPKLHAPYTIQTGVTLERQLTKSANLAVTYLNSRGVHEFYTNNLNPADPMTGQRVNFPDAGNIFQYQSQGIFKQNQVIVNGSIRMGTKLSLFGYYTLNYADSDTSGAESFPSNPYDLQDDYGRASYDIRHRLFLGGSIGLPRGFRLSPFLIASSGIPFNITSGTDPYQSNQYNVRPGFAACTPANQTKLGCFAIPTAADLSTYTPIPVNYGDGPGRFSLNLRLSKTFGFGPVLEGTSGGGGGPMGGGTFGRPGGGPRGGPGGGRGGPDAGATNRRYAVTFSVNARNVFNNVNLATPIGDLGSPFFGESNGLAGRPYSDSTSNRRLDLQMTFTF
jgi:Carboxypeptidase regulatory-like domain